MPRLCYAAALALLLAPVLAAQPFTLIQDTPIATNSPFSYGASWVDIDGDLDLDLYVGNPSVSFPGAYFRNDGDGTFTDLAGTVDAGDLLDIWPSSHGQSWADYDNDGDLDACIAGAPVSSIYRNDGGRLIRVSGATQTAGGLGADPNSRGWTCSWGDYDNDGLVDLFIANPAGFIPPVDQPLSNTLYRNAGNGGFVRVDDTPVTEGLAPYTVGRWMDYDADGDQDLFIGSGPANGTIDRDYLYRNLLTETGSASFERIEGGPLDQARDGQTWNVIDYDNDGDLDAYVTNYGNVANELFRNDDGTFVPIARSVLVNDSDASLANVWGDYDNDGDLDVFVVNEQGQPARFYENGGPPSYTFSANARLFSDLTMGIYGASAGDYDNDGDLDLVAVPVFPRSFGAIYATKLYRNDASEGSAPGGWLKLKLEGTASNRAGLGTILRAETTIGGVAQTLTREVSAQNTFNGHSSLYVHFGLGDAAQIDRLTIAWPSGMEDVFENVEVNRFVIAEEGGSLTPVTSEPVTPVTPNRLALDAAYPNPSADALSIRYVLPEADAVTLVVYDLLGRRVAKLVEAPQVAGEHTVEWDATDATGQRLGAGVYLYRLETGSGTTTKRLTLVR
ncbi:MAG: FG-GAP-like repeat-containing protein [Bacteroidota bacterium]